jgi:hypothetical protein
MIAMTVTIPIFLISLPLRTLRPLGVLGGREL